MAAKLRRARNHLAFCCEMYAYQIRHGRYFLHEHPLSATSWSEGCVQNIKKMPNVEVTTCHQCQYGAKSERDNPVRKATRFMANSPYILEELSRRCSGTHGERSRPGGGQHQQCLGRTARMAAIYPFQLCASILRGLNRQLIKDGVIISGAVGLHVVEEDVYIMNVDSADSQKDTD